MLSGLPATLNIPSGIQFSRLLFSSINSKTNLFLPIHPFSPFSSVITFARRRSNKSSEPSVSAQKPGKKKKNPSKELAQGEEEEDAFEALFRQLEEDLKNDGVSLDDEDDDFSEEDLAKLERELEEALKDDELFGALGLMGDAKVDDDDAKEEEGTTENADADSIANHDDQETEEEEGGEEEEEDDEDEEMPVKLKNWQRKRLAYALKSGRRKTSIKNLAAELCLDRSIVLQLLRDPPPDLLMLSATLPDKPASAIIEPVNNPTEIDPLEIASEIPKPEPEPELEPKRKAAAVKVPVHEMQSNWSANKRIKKAQLDTLELVYRRSKRPTNPMVSNIVHVTNLPRKKVLKWFEDKRGKEGVPDRRVPYQRSPSVSS